MKIVQINPGLLPIPPNGWGAIEKIIWEYTQRLMAAGHVCDIKYANEIKDGEYDVVHCHVANLTIQLKERGIKNVMFSLHDHHVELYDACRKENEQAMKVADFVVVHNQKYVGMFPNKNMSYLHHGVNTDFFYSKKLDLPGKSLQSDPKLLCVANNGLSGNSVYDRKGFKTAIKIAEFLDYDITIAGPTKNNKEFFDAHPELTAYKKLNLIYDLNEEQLKSVYSDHHIFLHYSMIEAGEPNLTVLEALSSGLPVIGFMSGPDTPGLYKVKGDELKRSIKYVNEICRDYDKISRDCRTSAVEIYNWDNVVKSLTSLYESMMPKKEVVNTSISSESEKMKNQLLKIYDIDGIIAPTNSEEKLDVSIFFIKNPRVDIKDGKGQYKVKFIKDGELDFESVISKGEFASANKQYFIDWTIEISKNDQVLLEHKYDASDKRVFITMDSKALGDTLAWIPYVEEFRKKHKCHVICSTFHNSLLEESYPNIMFTKPGVAINNLYAMYCLRFDWEKPNMMPNDVRTIPLQKVAADQLGIEYKEIRPTLIHKEMPNTVMGKYVCISTEGTTSSKLWHRKNGWQNIVDYLNSKGFQVMLIQKEKDRYSLNNIIKRNGNWPLSQRMNELYHSEFFIGLGSGMSWLAWAMKKKVVMISGFSDPFCEFQEDNYRLINRDVCNSCFNDLSHKFDRNWNWCPEHLNTFRQYECSKEITEEMVIDKINQIIG